MRKTLSKMKPANALGSYFAKHKKLIVVILLFVVIFKQFRSVSSGDYDVENFILPPTSKVLRSKYELPFFDAGEQLLSKDLSRTPITNSLVGEKYEDYEFKGFISNSVHLTGKCDELAYNGKIKYAKNSRILTDNYAEARQYILDWGNKYSGIVQHHDEKSWSVERIVKERWFEFGGTSVWLEKYQLFVVYSRLIYSHVGRRAHPKLSFIRGQLFDKEWNEVKNVRIPYNDVEIPADFEDQVATFKEANNCTENPQTCQAQLDSWYGRYYVKYPLVFDIPVELDGDWRGPEDSRVLLKKLPESDEVEPLVLFNQHDDIEGHRRMFALFPHKKHDSQVKFRSDSFIQNDSEKNWTPFFHNEYGENKVSRGFIHFVYSFLPLEILRCSLDDGLCDKVFKASTLDLTESNQYRGMRGGTQYVPLPKEIPELENKQIWIGFPKLHTSKCNCGDKFYRPMFSVLIESDGVYHQELIVPSVDFNREVLSWNLKDYSCYEISIMSPNSIAFWEIKSQNPETKEYDDYMTILVSEADFLTRTISMKGILNYIMRLYDEKKRLKENFEVSNESNKIVLNTLQCVAKLAKEVCMAYGKTHPEIK